MHLKLKPPILLFLLILFFAEISKSQTKPDLPKVIPVSPTAAALGQYGNIPISLYTGLPDISIPIWDMKGREINLPISLSYRASGIKVEENASWVGLGWSLNAGGVITRTIRDKPDFGIGIYGRANLPLSNATPATFQAIHEYHNSSFYDLEPDIFYYNFNGKSGSFSFDAQGIARFSQFDDIQIKYTPDIEYVPGIGSYGQFEITTSDGTLYVFKDRETTVLNSAPTSWYLSKITSPSGKEIFDFIYEREDYCYQNAVRNEIYTSPTVVRNEIVEDNSPSVIFGKRLKEISTNTVGKIHFVPNEQRRRDFRYMYNAYMLKDVKIYNSRNEQIKMFRLETEDVETSIKVDPGNQIYYDNEYLNWRIYLKSLKEYDATQTQSKPAYVFSYYDRDSNGKDLLPNRVSFAQDHWGYYNGMNDNLSLVPPYTGPFGTLDPFFDIFDPKGVFDPNDYGLPYFTFNMMTGDRTPGFPNMRAGTLRSIQYPTGGRSEFEYEPHHGIYISQDVSLMDYSGIVGGLRIKSVSNYDLCENIIEKKEYEYSVGDLVDFPKYRTYKYHNWTGEPSMINLFPIPGLPVPTTDGKPFLYINPNSFTLPGSTKGSVIGYREVWEKNSGKGGTIYRYTSSTGNFGDERSYTTTYTFRDPANLNYIEEHVLPYSSNFAWPYNPSKNNDWKRGLLLSKTVMDAAGNGIVQEDYEYGMTELGSIPGLRTRVGRYGLDYFYSQYTVPYGWNYLQKKTVKEFAPSGQFIRNVVNSYEYEPLYKYKRREKTLDSSGDSLITAYTYPFDYAGAPYSTMTARHIIAPVIEAKNYKNSLELNTLTNDFKDWFGNQKLITPEVVKTRQGINGLTETRVRFHDMGENGNILSVSKENGGRISYIWDYNSVYPIAEVQNATTDDIAYTSFEADGIGNWTFSGGAVLDQNARTGQSSYNLNGSNSISKGNLTPSKNYIVSYWSRNGAYNVNNSVAKTGISNNGWTYFEHEISGASVTSVQGSGSLDELRLYPKDALMTTFTYQPSIGMSSSADTKNEIKYFDYDDFGRLKMIRDYEKNVIKKIEYNYNSLGQNGCNQTVYYNVEKSQGFMKSSCGVGSAPVIYKVSAKTFSSIISQADADQKAQNIIDTYGQSYANNSKECKYYNDEISGYYTAVGCGPGFEGTSIYVHVPANTYSGSSKQDANSLAQSYAQSYANSNGCRPAVPAFVNVKVVNTDYISGFKAKFVNDYTHAEYQFDMDYSAIMGQVPSGSYTITIYVPNGVSSTNFTFGVAEYSSIGTSGVFPYVDVSSSEIILSINP
jgi:hypothetical protein